MASYSTREAAEVLGLSQERVRRLAESASLHPERASRAWYRFDFRDLVLLRTALELEKSGVSPRRLLRSLRDLKRQLPADRPLTAIRITLEADELVVQDDDLAWNPESGQVQLGLQVEEAGGSVESLDRRRARPVAAEKSLDAVDWYELGCGLQAQSPEQAADAFRRAVELDAGLADAHINLGVLLHEGADLEGAEMCYRLALRADPRVPPPRTTSESCWRIWESPRTRPRCTAGPSNATPCWPTPTTICPGCTRGRGIERPRFDICAATANW